MSCQAHIMRLFLLLSGLNSAIFHNSSNLNKQTASSCYNYAHTHTHTSNGLFPLVKGDKRVDIMSSACNLMMHPGSLSCTDTTHVQRDASGVQIPQHDHPGYAVARELPISERPHSITNSPHNQCKLTTPGPNARLRNPSHNPFHGNSLTTR